MNRLQVAAFYAFTPLNEQQRGSLLSDLPDMANTNNVLGSILVAELNQAPEGRAMKL